MSVGLREPDAQGRGKTISNRLRDYLIVFEYVAQLFFQLPLGQNVFDAAPSCLPAFACGHRFGSAFCALDEGIEVVRFFGFPEKLIVNIEMFVFAFTHFSRKAPEINGIEQLKS
jgi:hypothetical protein